MWRRAWRTHRPAVASRHCRNQDTHKVICKTYTEKKNSVESTVYSFKMTPTDKTVKFTAQNQLTLIKPLYLQPDLVVFTLQID